MDAQAHIRCLREARGLLIDVTSDQEASDHAYNPDSDVGKALEAAILSIELAWSLIEATQEHSTLE